MRSWLQKINGLSLKEQKRRLANKDEGTASPALLYGFPTEQDWKNTTWTPNGFPPAKMRKESRDDG
jgi:hypothetical protein